MKGSHIFWTGLGLYLYGWMGYQIYLDIRSEWFPFFVVITFGYIVFTFLVAEDDEPKRIFSPLHWIGFIFKKFNEFLDNLLK